MGDQIDFLQIEFPPWKDPGRKRDSRKNQNFRGKEKGEEFKKFKRIGFPHNLNLSMESGKEIKMDPEKNIQYWKDEISFFISQIRGGGDPEDIQSWRHELGIAQRNLKELERKEKWIMINI